MSEITDQLKQEAERKYPDPDWTVENPFDPREQMKALIASSQREAYIAGVLSRSGGVWVKATKNPDKKRYNYHVKMWAGFADSIFNGTCVFNEGKWECAPGYEVLEYLDESPAADKGDAIEFARWLGEFCNPYVDNANVHTFLRDNKDYSLEQLYELFHQSK